MPRTFSRAALASPRPLANGFPSGLHSGERSPAFTHSVTPRSYMGGSYFTCEGQLARGCGCAHGMHGVWLRGLRLQLQGHAAHA
jgi:hypothetical protein